MKKKISAKDNLNLLFSAILVVMYTICAYFFVNIANSQTGVLKPILMALIMVVFGLVLFYATRVGDGKSVKRFSVITLVVMVLPSLYVVLASIFTALPLSNFIAANSVVGYIAAVALGYGIPYTFISGFELVVEPEEEIVEEFAEGGIEQEIFETEQATDDVEEEVEELVVDGTAVIEDEENVAENTEEPQEETQEQE